MATQTLWEYKAISVGGLWGAKGAEIEAKLNELGLEGWEVVAAELVHGGAKLVIIAKRALSPTERRRRRELPQQ